MNFQSATSVSNTEAVEVIYKNSLLNLAAPFNGTFTLTAGSCMGFRFFMQDLGGGPQDQFNIEIDNTTSGQFWEGFIVLQPNINLSVAILGIPVAANAGDVITVHIGSNHNVNIQVAITAIGAEGAILTAPGLPISNYPVGGLLAAHVSSVVGNVQILPTPPLDMAYRLHSVVAFNPSARSWLIDPSSNTYAAMSQAGTGNEGYCALHGNLCQTALSINSGSAGIGVTLQYDLISLPQIT